MPISQNPATRGFQLVGDANPDYVKLRPTRAKNGRAIFKGDVVTVAAPTINRGITPIADAVSGAANSLPWGVVMDVFNNNRRPYTFNQPGQGPFIPASTQGYATVYEDPNALYVANTSTTATFRHVGTFASIRVCAPNTAVGRSGMSIDLTTNSTAATGQPLKVVEISPMDTGLEESPVSGFANQDVVVKFIQHEWLHPHNKVTTGVQTSG